uniref:Cation channel sperm-associated protein 1 n=1 Tax=Rhinolophus ferrumequinum TaxID=59479 RepID=A0A671DT51_RHIFE
MQQPSMAEKAQNEADTSDLDVLSRPSSSTPPHRPRHSGVHRHHNMSHRGESHHLGEFQNFPDDAISHHSHLSPPHRHSPRRDGAQQSTSPAPDPSHGTVLSHRSYDEDDLDDDRRHGNRRHHDRSHHHRESYYHGPMPQYLSESYNHGRPPDPSGSHHQSEVSRHSVFPEPYHHKESDHVSEARHHEGPHHYDAYDDSGHHHHQAHHHRRPPHHTKTHSHLSYEGSNHQGTSHDPNELHYGHPSKHHHRARHHDYPRSGHHYGEYHHGGSQVSGQHKSHSKVRVGSAYSRAAALQPSVARIQSMAIGMTRSHSTGHSQSSQRSSKVHPQDSSSKTSESWAENDEQFQKHKTGRAQRAHKKPHSVGCFSWLWEKLSNLLQGFREMIRNLTESLFFEVFIFLVVCLNTIMLVAQTFAEVEIRGEWYFMMLDSIFLCIYVVEAMLKIIALGFKYFSDSWNNLDFFIVVMAVLDFMLMQINSSTFKRTVYNQSVVRIFKVFKSLRALRAIRVLRRLSILTSLQKVTATLVRSLPSITAILILMFTCLFLFSVVLRALFRHSDPKRFQNIFTTIFTLFTLLTLDDWSLIYLDSRAQGAWYIIPILMIYIIIQYFIFLNLVIAVLVDNFQMALLQGLEKMKQEKAAQIHEKLLDESLTELSQTEPEEVMSEHTKYKRLIEKKFGTLTEKQQELLFHFLQLVASVEHYQQKFRSQASVIDEIVDTAFEAGEEDFRRW